MKYAGAHDFTSQINPAIPHVSNVGTFFKKLKSTLALQSKPRFDPTRLTETERREAGIMECEVEWYKAWNWPLVK